MLNWSLTVRRTDDSPTSPASQAVRWLPWTNARRPRPSHKPTITQTTQWNPFKNRFFSCQSWFSLRFLYTLCFDREVMIFFHHIFITLTFTYFAFVFKSNCHPDRGTFSKFILLNYLYNRHPPYRNSFNSGLYSGPNESFIGP